MAFIINASMSEMYIFIQLSRFIVALAELPWENLLVKALLNGGLLWKELLLLLPLHKSSLFHARTMSLRDLLQCLERCLLLSSSSPQDLNACRPYAIISRIHEAMKAK